MEPVSYCSVSTLDGIPYAEPDMVITAWSLNRPVLCFFFLFKAASPSGGEGHLVIICDLDNELVHPSTPSHHDMYLKRLKLWTTVLSLHL